MAFMANEIDLIAELGTGNFLLYSNILADICVNGLFFQMNCICNVLLFKAVTMSVILEL